MARTIAQIQQSIIDAKTADSTLAGLSSTSNVAIWLLWTYVVAACQWVLESLFDAHKSEVSSIIAGQRPHTLQWYVYKALQFQFGVALPADSDTYATESADPAVVIVKYASAVELSNLVRIKVATVSGGVLAPLLPMQLLALVGYMGAVKDAGVRLQVTSGAPDVLRLVLHIYYDPLVLDNTGARLDGTAGTPVKDAINSMLNNLPFNGLFVLNNLIAALQAVDGVLIGSVVSAAATYASLPYVPVPVEYTPDAGYLILDEAFLNANITYTAHGPI
jgi:hypothetical protein